MATAATGVVAASADHTRIVADSLRSRVLATARGNREHQQSRLNRSIHQSLPNEKTDRLREVGMARPEQWSCLPPTILPH
jgi:hypothetical protein